jgi:hypothetical protein
MKLYQMAEQFLDLPQMLRLKSDYGLNLPISNGICQRGITLLLRINIVLFQDSYMVMPLAAQSEFSL